MRFLAALVLVVLLLGSSASAADEAGELFNSIYGARLRQVRATVSAADDLVLAEELLAAARTSQDAPAILVILCDNAYALARKGRDGLGTAIEAAEFLGARVPEKRIESLEKVRQIRQRLYLAARGAEKAAQGEALIGSLLALAEAAKQANDLDGAVAHGRRALTTATAIKSRRRARIQADLDELIVRQQIGKREARWKDRLKANPKDQTALTALMRLYVVELDDPQRARRYRAFSSDETWKTNVGLAVKGVESLSGPEAMAMGDWYRRLAGEASEAGQTAMLKRAEAYYQHFLDQPGPANLARTKAELAIKGVQALLKTAPGNVDPRGLVLHFVFKAADVKEGRVADASENGNHGTMHNARFVEDSPLGGGYRMADRNQYISVANSKSLELADHVSLALWFRLESFGPSGYGNEEGHLIKKGDPAWWNPGFVLGYRKVSRLARFVIGDPARARNGGGQTVMGTTKLDVDRWYHLAGTYDGKVARVYLDGMLEAEKKYNGRLRQDKAPIMLGGGQLFRTAAFANHFAVRGAIDDVRIYNRSLTGEEVALLARRK